MANLRANKITTGTADYQGSIYANGTGAYLLTKTTAPGTDDFTIEFWINSDAADSSTQEGLFAINAAVAGFQGGSGNQIRLVQGRDGTDGQNGGLEVNINGTAVGTGDGNDIIAEGTWYHVAVTRASGTVKIWVDGVEKASGSAAGDVTGTTFTTAYYDSNYTFQGYMSNFRYRKGTAHYTTTFTPPTGPLERTTDTELIFAQSVNNAGNGYSSAIHGGTTDIMQVNGNVTASTSAPTLTTSSSVGVVFGGSTKHNSLGYMYLPTGDTGQRGRGRAVFGGGGNPGALSRVDYITIQSTGNAVSFGSLTAARVELSACGSATRGVFCGGATPTRVNTLDYITFTTTGNATDFGDSLQVNSGSGSCGSDTRGIMMGGRTPTNLNTIQYLTFATTANTTDFGDLVAATRNTSACSSPTRGVQAGGTASNDTNTMEYITIASTGNATDFGDIVDARHGLTAWSSNTRGCYAAGYDGADKNIIEYITIATTGNTTDFGDLGAIKGWPGRFSNCVRGGVYGGWTPSSPSRTNTIEYVNIATTGNANDFGDTYSDGVNSGPGGCSDSGGGLTQ